MPGDTPYKIDDELIERARVLGRGWWEIPAEGNPELAREVRARAAAERCTARELLWRDALEFDVSSPKNGALYWGYQHPADPTVESHYITLAWAERHNAQHPDRPVVTFWTTAGGARMYEFNRLNHAERKLLGFDTDYLVRVWESMCLRFAAQTSGETLVFATYFHPRVILGRTELPALRRNPSVGPDRIRFVYPPPKHLSDGRPLTDNLREVLAAPGNQACIQFDAPDHPGYLDVELANRLSYRLLVEEVGKRRCEVEATDRDWSPMAITPDCPAGIQWYPPVVGKPATAAST